MIGPLYTSRMFSYFAKVGGIKVIAWAMYIIGAIGYVIPGLMHVSWKREHMDPFPVEEARKKEEAEERAKQ